MASKAAIRIGISGWTYAPWRGKFFPEGLRQKDKLRYAAAFPTIEINGTFYGTQHRKGSKHGSRRSGTNEPFITNSNSIR
jgi:uncharacterized protein YecE (DUF72 family)